MLRFAVPHLLWITLILAPGLVSSVSAEISGSHRYRTYTGRVQTPTVECLFSVDIEDVAFSLTSVASKYKLVRIDIDNRSKVPLVLSSERDRFEASFGTQVVPA